jgi:hypothetical protein
MVLSSVDGSPARRQVFVEDGAPLDEMLTPGDHIYGGIVFPPPLISIYSRTTPCIHEHSARWGRRYGEKRTLTCDDMLAVDSGMV